MTFSAPRGVISEIVTGKPGQAHARGASCSTKTSARAGRNSMPARSWPQLDVIQQRGLTIDSVRPKTFVLDIDKLVRQPADAHQAGVRRAPGRSRGAQPQHLSTSLCRDDWRTTWRARCSVWTSAATSTPASRGRGSPGPSICSWPADVPGSQYVRFEPATFGVKLPPEGHHRPTDLRERAGRPSV